MVDGIRDCGRNTCKPDLAHPSRASWIQLVIRLVQEGDFDPGAVGVRRHDVVREVGVDGSAGALVILIALKQSHPDAHNDCTRPGCVQWLGS